MTDIVTFWHCDKPSYRGALLLKTKDLYNQGKRERKQKNQKIYRSKAKERERVLKQETKDLYKQGKRERKQKTKDL